MRNVKQFNLKLMMVVLSLLCLAHCATARTQRDICNNGSNNSFAMSHYHLSVRQLCQAAESGDPDAQYALGYMAYYGKDVPRDIDLAKKWIGRAANQGQPQAIKAARMLATAEPCNGQPRRASYVAENDNLNQNFQTFGPVAPETGSSKIFNTPTKKIVMKEEPAKMTQVALSSTEDHLLHVPDNYFTVQLMGSYHKNDVSREMNTLHLQEKATIYHTYLKNRDWYVLISGEFSSRVEATKFAHQLEGHDGIYPWVKPFTMVKAGIREQSHG